MSIIQQHTASSLSDNWRTINIDALDPDSSANFPLHSLAPSVSPFAEAEIRTLGTQVRQLLRGGDVEGALRGALEGAPVGAEERVRDVHLTTVTEILQSIKASDMTPMLERIFATDGGAEVLDTLMKYLYKGMAHNGPSASSSHLQRSRTSLTPQQTGAIGGRGTAAAGGGGENSGAAMSVLLSWHEKVVEVAGPGCIGRVMSDRRLV